MPGAVLSRNEVPDISPLEERSWAARLGMMPALRWGYVGLLLFMIGDGVESGFLSPYLIDEGFAAQSVAFIFTLYGIVAGVSAWSSGALSDLWGPRQVMVIGAVIWATFEIVFLTVALPSHNYTLTLLSYGIRGIGYPLFAYGFLVWIAAATPQRRLGTAVGWFWFAFTGGFPTLGSLIASFTVPQLGAYTTFWISLGLVVAGALIALIFTREPIGMRRLAPAGQKPVATLLASITLMFSNLKIGAGAITRAINTASQIGFLVFLPIFFTQEIGFTLEQWLRILTIMFTSNIFFNLFFGVIGDKVGWRNTVVWFGGIGCAITTLLLYYVPTAVGPNFALAALVAILYGATLAGYVPLSALMPSLAPHAKGAAMSALNFGAGMSAFLGPLVVAIFLGPFGVVGVMWIFAGLHVVSAVLAMFLKLPPGVEDAAEASAQASGHFIGTFAARAGSTLLGHPVAMRTPLGEDDIDAVLFDIGGTVYDDDRYAQALLRATRELTDGELDEQEFWHYYDQQREGGGEGLRVSFARRYLASGDPKELFELIKKYWDYPPTALYPDVVPTLLALHGRYKLGLLANSPVQVREALHRDGIDALVDGILLGGTDGPEKPNPAIFRQALDALGVPASRAVYVGNRLDTDVRGSQAAGLRCVWMLRGEASPAPTLEQLGEPDAVVTSLVGLPIALARLTGQGDQAVSYARTLAS